MNSQEIPRQASKRFRERARCGTADPDFPGSAAICRDYRLPWAHGVAGSNPVAPTNSARGNTGVMAMRRKQLLRPPSVAHVVNLIANGMTPQQVASDLPDLDLEDIHQALAYAAALAKDELHPLRA